MDANACLQELAMCQKNREQSTSNAVKDRALKDKSRANPHR